jgi:hypothetical protein
MAITVGIMGALLLAVLVTPSAAQVPVDPYGGEDVLGVIIEQPTRDGQPGGDLPGDAITGDTAPGDTTTAPGDVDRSTDRAAGETVARQVRTAPSTVATARSGALAQTGFGLSLGAVVALALLLVGAAALWTSRRHAAKI